MKKPNVTKLIQKGRKELTKRAPEIAVGMGIGGMITTVVLAVNATPKAMELIEQKKKEEQVDKLTPIETVKVAWKPYLPAVITGTLSISCLVFATAESSRRAAVFATAYQLSEAARKEYREAVIEQIGEKKEELVRDKVAKKQIEKNPSGAKEIIITDKGNTLCYDALSGRYFNTDIDHIKKVEYELNRRLIYDMYISLNEFYSALGLDHIDLGDDIGWNIDWGRIEFEYSSQLTDKNEPCLVISYNVKPRYNFDR